MNEQDIAVREFLVESYENLDQLERDLVHIEAKARDRETLDQIFRTIHSIKGACGFLAYPKLEAVAHAGEGLLCLLRDGEIPMAAGDYQRSAHPVRRDAQALGKD